MKKGFFSSEFVAVIGYAVLVALNKKLGLGIDDTTLQGLVAAVATYVAGRSWVKREEIKKNGITS